jgi:GAF domain-containing protein
VQQLQSLLLTTPDVTAFLTKLAVLSTEILTTARLACGITMRYDGNMLTVASSDARAERLDETQYRNRTGPCLTAIQTAQVTASDNTRTERRWPAYTSMAIREGLRCSLSLPLISYGITFGAMNVYGFERPHLFGDTEQRQYRLYAEQASSALRLASRQLSDAAQLTQLEQALNSRTVIDQAIGILIARHQLTATEAFELLRAQSQNSHRKLREIATELVTRASGQPPEPGRPFNTT